MIIFALLALPSLGSPVSSLPHQLDIKMLVWFSSSVSLLSSLLFFLSCLPSCLVVPSFCWSIT